MGCFIIDADTCRAWKSVGDPGCRASPVAPEYLSTHGVEFPGCRARSDGLHHGLAGLGDNTTSTKECIEIFLRIDRHSRILRLDRDAPPRRTGTLDEFGTADEHAEGWYHDPSQRHEARWYSDGTATDLVPDGHQVAHDAPPPDSADDPLEPWEGELPAKNGDDLRRADERTPDDGLRDQVKMFNRQDAMFGV